jgi:hypothetical protein
VQQNKWDGRPQEPKRASYHWLMQDSFGAEAVPVRWQSGTQTWRVGPAQDDNMTSKQIVAEGYGYHGECQTGAEIAQLRAALAWIGQVHPATDRQSGNAVVHTTWDEWNALRRAMRLLEQRPLSRQ